MAIFSYNYISFRKLLQSFNETMHYRSFIPWVTSHHARGVAEGVLKAKLSELHDILIVTFTQRKITIARV